MPGTEATDAPQTEVPPEVSESGQAAATHTPLPWKPDWPKSSQYPGIITQELFPDESIPVGRPLHFHELEIIVPGEDDCPEPYAAYRGGVHGRNPAEIAGNLELIVAAVNSYGRHCGDRALECAKDDLLGRLLKSCDEALARLREHGETKENGSYAYGLLRHNIRIATGRLP